LGAALGVPLAGGLSVETEQYLFEEVLEKYSEEDDEFIYTHLEKVLMLNQKIRKL